MSKVFHFAFRSGVTEMHVHGIKGTSCSAEVAAVQNDLKAKLDGPPQFTNEFYEDPSGQQMTQTDQLTSFG